MSLDDVTEKMLEVVKQLPEEEQLQFCVELLKECNVQVNYMRERIKQSIAKNDYSKTRDY